MWNRYMTFFLFLTAVFAVGQVFGGDLKLLLLHTNDMHSHFEEMSSTGGICPKKGHCYGGFARLIETVADIKKEQHGKRNIVFLNAGDNFVGTEYYAKYKWKIVAMYINKLKLDAMALGNREFDGGVKALSDYLKEVKTVSVAANIDTSKEPSLHKPTLAPYKILNINKVKVAVVGYVSPQTKLLSSPGKVKFLDEVESINKVTAQLKKKGVKIFIALGHSGFNVDKRIAEKCPDIDVVVGGQTNTFLYNGHQPDREVPVGKYPTVVSQSNGKKVPVVQAYAYTKYLGNLELDFDEQGDLKTFAGNPILLNYKYKEDQHFLKALKPYSQQIAKTTKKVLGVTEVLLDADNYACKLRECNIGNLIADSMIQANIKHISQLRHAVSGWTDAPIALMPAGSIKSSIDASENKGVVTYGDVLNVLYVGDPLVKVDINGKRLKDAFEHAVAKYEDTKTDVVGEFLQVSGVRVAYAIKNKPGNRVTNLEVLCGECHIPAYSKVNDKKTYRVVMPESLVKSLTNETFEYITNLSNNTKGVTPIKVNNIEALVDYIKSRTPVYPGIANRITVSVEKPHPHHSTTKHAEKTTTTTEKTTTTHKPSSASTSQTIISLLLFTTVFVTGLPNLLL